MRILERVTSLMAMSFGRWLGRLRGAGVNASVPDRRAGLEQGTHGVTVTFPGAWPVVHSFRNDGVILQDPDHGVHWTVVHSLFPLSLADEEAHILVDDIRDSTRVAFATYLRESHAEGTDKRSVWRLSITVDGEVASDRFETEMDALAASWQPK